MAKRGRPRKTEESGVHKVSYYKPKPEMASKALHKVYEERLKAGYIKLFTLAYEEPNQRNMIEINIALRQGLELL